MNRTVFEVCKIYLYGVDSAVHTICSIVPKQHTKLIHLKYSHALSVNSASKQLVVKCTTHRVFFSYMQLLIMQSKKPELSVNNSAYAYLLLLRKKQK